MASMTRARRSSATSASAASLTRSTSGAPNSMTSLPASSALDPEDMDTETIIAGGSVSRRSSAASTERTARPFGRGLNRPSRGSVVTRNADDPHRGANEQDPGRDIDPPSAVSRDATASSTGKGPMTRAVSSFAALRSRIIEYLDEPLSEPRSENAQPRTESHTSGNEERRNRPRRQAHATVPKPWRILSLLRPRYLATLALGVLFLVASRQWRRKNRKALASTGQSTGSTIPLWYIMASQWWRSIFEFAWQKFRMMISMGTTLTYV